MNKNSKGTTRYNSISGFAHLFLLLVLSFVLIVGVGYCAYKNGQIKLTSQQTTTQHTPTPSFYPKPNSSTKTANWKTYRNEEYGFVTKYYPESKPSEQIGTEEAGQFTYLLLVKFGTVPLKSIKGYSLTVDKPKSLDDYRTDLIGHITDKIDSEEKITVNNNSWTKINYKIFLTTNNITVTTAITKRGEYNYTITAPSGDIDQILSTFQFIDTKRVKATK